MGFLSKPSQPPPRRELLTLDSIIAKLCILTANSENKEEALVYNKALNILIEYQIQQKRY